MVPRSLVVALASLVAALAAAAPAQAIVGGQVSGGTSTPDTSYPWQVAITTTMDNQDWFCGGTRVASDLVLTAAHCVIDDDGRIAVPGHVTVFSGNTVLSSTTFSRATAVALYPGLNLQATPNGTPSGDLALVRIPSSAPGSPVSVIDASEAALLGRRRIAAHHGLGLHDDGPGEHHRLRRAAQAALGERQPPLG